MSPIQSIQNLTIDFSRLGAIELHGEPISKKPCLLRLAFNDTRYSDSLQISFGEYREAQKMYDSISKSWVAFEQKKSRATLLAEAEKELYF